MSWLKLHRKLSRSDLWLGEVFTRGQAWVDLLMLANFEPGYIRKRGVRIDLEPGQVGWSIRSLSRRWGWSIGKTQRFLGELKRDLKIDTQTGTLNSSVTISISITNWFEYQENDTQTGTQTEHRRVQKKKGKKYIDTFIENKGIVDLAEPNPRETVPYVKIVQAYHDACPMLPKCRMLTDARRQAIRNRWTQFANHEQGPMYAFEVVFAQAAASDFLTRKWGKANLDWIIKQSNFIKIAEGNYDDK